MAPSDGTVRKLVRSRSNRWLGGVCGGLAEYFNADPALFRIVFTVLTFIGWGIPLYLVTWLIIPDEGEETSVAESFIRKAREGRGA